MKRKSTSVLLVFVLTTKKKNKKTEKRKLTSVLSFFVLCTKNKKRRKAKIDFRFIVFRFNYDQLIIKIKYNPIFRFFFFPFSSGCLTKPRAVVGGGRGRWRGGG